MTQKEVEKMISSIINRARSEAPRKVADSWDAIYFVQYLFGKFLNEKFAKFDWDQFDIDCEPSLESPICS